MFFSTGEPPADPSIGFLPPNNITSGQGFVTFSVFVDDDANNLATIDAEASIVFDVNEPIDTPPIFNTVRIFFFLHDEGMYWGTSGPSQLAVACSCSGTLYIVV